MRRFLCFSSSIYPSPSTPHHLFASSTLVLFSHSIFYPFTCRLFSSLLLSFHISFLSNHFSPTICFHLLSKLAKLPCFSYVSNHLSCLLHSPSPLLFLPSTLFLFSGEKIPLQYTSRPTASSPSPLELVKGVRRCSPHHTTQQKYKQPKPSRFRGVRNSPSLPSPCSLQHPIDFTFILPLTVLMKHKQKKLWCFVFSAYINTSYAHKRACVCVWMRLVCNVYDIHVCVCSRMKKVGNMLMIVDARLKQGKR